MYQKNTLWLQLLHASKETYSLLLCKDFYDCYVYRYCRKHFITTINKCVNESILWCNVYIGFEDTFLRFGLCVKVNCPLFINVNATKQILFISCVLYRTKLDRIQKTISVIHTMVETIFLYKCIICIYENIFEGLWCFKSFISILWV